MAPMDDRMDTRSCRVTFKILPLPLLCCREEAKVDSEAAMDEISGRGHREKKPSEKLKEQVSGKIDKIEDDRPVVLPTYIAPNDPKFLQDQKEIPKFLDHTKIAPNGEKTDFFNLGTQYESYPRGH